MKQPAKKVFAVENMHCTSCAMNIDFDLEDLPGVVKASTSYARSESIVEFDESSVTVEQIVQQVKKTGYDITVKE